MSDQVTSVQTSDDLQLLPNVWYVNRELDFKPMHFVTAKTPITTESVNWIVHNLSGRYTLQGYRYFNESYDECILPSFEDPTEAMLYELTWS